MGFGDRKRHAFAKAANLGRKANYCIAPAKSTVTSFLSNDPQDKIIKSSLYFMIMTRKRAAHITVLTVLQTTSNQILLIKGNSNSRRKYNGTTAKTVILTLRNFWVGKPCCACLCIVVVGDVVEKENRVVGS